MSLHTYMVEDEAVGGKLKDKPSVPQSSDRGLYKRKEKCKKIAIVTDAASRGIEREGK